MVTKSTVQDCLDYCVSISECVGVDIDYHRDPVWCWLHSHPSDYVDTNVYSQLGTNSYQLVRIICRPELINATG